MKKSIFYSVLFLILITSIQASAQRANVRIGYVDMDYILENVPEYQEAQKQLDEKVKTWKTDIDKKLQAIDQLKKTLENERALLTPELIDEKEEEIDFLQNEVLDYKEDRFGVNGDLMRQRKNLVTPVQDQVFNAVQEISKNRAYDFVFDKTSDLLMLYADKKHDVSDQVLLSINRASKRRQVNSKKEKKELELDEAKTVEQERALTDREKEAARKKAEQEKIIEGKKAAKDALRAAKLKEFEERRQELLAEKQSRKDSILKERERRKDSIRNLTIDNDNYRR